MNYSQKAHIQIVLQQIQVQSQDATMAATANSKGLAFRLVRYFMNFLSNII